MTILSEEQITTFHIEQEKSYNLIYLKFFQKE